MEKTVRFENVPEEKQDKIQKTGLTDEELGYLSLRTNYKRVKPHSKYTEEGIRPRSPNVPYSFLSEELIKNNPKSGEAIFRQTTNLINPDNDVKNNSKISRHAMVRSCDTINQHLIRGMSASQPYCYITKEAYNRDIPPEYTASRYGAYPTWGPAETGYRTRSHYVAEPAEKFANIDMYKRPPTNQTGAIIFDHGRPNNGYYLQRKQYDNTWFNSNIKLNQTGILDSIAPKTKAEYDYLRDNEKRLTRSKTMDWPYASEYVEKFILNTKA